MVSFWPFKGDDTSAASFEKILSQLSAKITKAGALNDSLRQQQRRNKVLWTLYSTFAYILVALILLLVTGYQRWGSLEYSAVVGGPVLIYGIRTALDAYYNIRLSRSQEYLNDLTKQRETAIEKLKKATKYNSTQQLLDKYGGLPRKRQPSPHAPQKRKSEGPVQQGPRTGFAPPPTANIPRPQPGVHVPPDRPDGVQRVPSGLAPPEIGAWVRPAPQADVEVSEDFAPNAFPATPPRLLPSQNEAQQYASDAPRWYDRIMDVVLGEDETLAKNRIALICQSCRLVNGQAPPGARTLEDVGRWRCGSCQAWNGVESEEKKILKQVGGEVAEPQSPTSPAVPQSAVTDPGPHTVALEHGDAALEHDDHNVEDDHENDEPEMVQLGEDSPAASTRSKARQRKKAG